MKKRNLIISVILVLIIISGLTTLIIAVNKETEQTESTLLKTWDNYMERNGFLPLEVHQEDNSFIFSMFVNERKDKFGIIEYSENHVKEEVKPFAGTEFSYVYLNGNFKNYIGIKFKENAEVGKISIINDNGGEQEYTIYNEENDFTKSDILIETEFPKENITKIKFYRKSNELLSEINIAQDN